MRAKILIFSLLITFTNLFFPVSVLAANGGFYMLDGPPGGIYAGGTILLDWRDFEPIEGQYRWDYFTSETGGFIPWLPVFNNRIRGTNEQAWQPNMYGFFKQLVQNGKTVRFKLRVTEGAMPLWLYGGEDVNGKSSSSYGTICAYKTYEQAWAKEPDCNPNTDIVIAMTYPLYPEKEDNAEPVWWNPVFQEKFAKVIRDIGNKISNDPVLSKAIEYVEASVGSYGEMILYGKSDTFETDSSGQRLFKRAGYTNAKYSNAVINIIDNYEAAFPNHPIALSLGSGLYSSPLDDGSGVTSVMVEVVSKMTARYKSKLYLKFAGFGMGRGAWVGNLFRQYCPATTRCIYESAATITSWPGWPWNDDPSQLEAILSWAVEDEAYILMMWWGDMRAINNGHSALASAFDRVAPRLVELGNISIPPFPSVTILPTPSLSITPTSGVSITPTSTVSVSPTVTRVPTNTSIPPSPTATSIPVVNINLVTGWNNIPWQNNYPTAKKFSDVPDACSIIELNSNGLWRIYVKSYGGENLNFERDKSYSIRCNTNTEWRI